MPSTELISSEGTISELELTLARLLRSRSVAPNIVAKHKLPAKQAAYAPFPEQIPDKLKSAYTSRGFDALYTHQALATEHALSGQHIVVVTPTASGKTACYNLPVLSDLVQDETANALYLFPTKALTQDQRAELARLNEDGDLGICGEIYDGDTPSDKRRRIRDGCQIIMSNPDMVHSGILPYHGRWARFFQNLKYVVIDELHIYRGVFGSHMANVLRRLKRLAGHYGAKPTFICTSATIANPAQLATNLIGDTCLLIDENGAPRGEKWIMVYNPPVIDKATGMRASAVNAARGLTQRLFESGLHTIVFAMSRLNVEVLTRYLQEMAGSPKDAEKIRAYRGGYLPNLRREIEKGLRDGSVKTVVSTNALELGIDIGSLDACIMTGYPGSVASTWQQIGRAGRRNKTSAAFLVARNMPLDQFVAADPDYVLETNPEHGLIHADNPAICNAHLACAAFELPFSKNERFGERTIEEAIQELKQQGKVTEQGDRYYWSTPETPASAVSLRNIPGENCVVVDVGNESKVIGEVDHDSVPTTVHEGAIYMMQAKPYQVEKLDYDGKKAYARPVDVDYYTDAITYTRIKKLSTEVTQGEASHGEVAAITTIPGFKKVKLYTHENLGYGEIDLPEQQMHTSSYWWTLPEDLPTKLDLSVMEIAAGATGLAHLLHHLACLILMCDRRDLSRTVGDAESEWFATPEVKPPFGYNFSHLPPKFQPTIYIFDHYPGGLGFSEVLFKNHAQLLEWAAERIADCPCQSGCPSCVGPILESPFHPKQVAMKMLASS